MRLQSNSFKQPHLFETTTIIVVVWDKLVVEKTSNMRILLYLIVQNQNIRVLAIFTGSTDFLVLEGLGRGRRKRRGRCGQRKRCKRCRRRALCGQRGRTSNAVDAGGLLHVLLFSLLLLLLLHVQLLRMLLPPPP